ncbi:hypothetical protein EC957_011247 [Mortierella hygrophila]|uniref:Uncharacterized protein n=1 Tax=Mortierella hygrophila TaxID=979708 RepID=A0A9P6F9R3_9FUNG|nr:hypothetical protein EC957_011247 [Mortierella hygrophila]
MVWEFDIIRDPDSHILRSLYHPNSYARFGNKHCPFVLVPLPKQAFSGPESRYILLKFQMLFEAGFHWVNGGKLPSILVRTKLVQSEFDKHLKLEQKRIYTVRIPEDKDASPSSSLSRSSGLQRRSEGDSCLDGMTHSRNSHQPATLSHAHTVHAMDTLKTRSKRRSSPRKTPYARPEGESHPHIKKEEEPSLQTRIARFLMPWISESSSQEQSKETEQTDDDKTAEDTSARDHHTTEAEDEENTGRRTSTSNDQDESIEIIEDSDPVATMHTEDSQLTLIAPSQEDESNLTPEGSFIEGSVTDAAEDLIDAARRMEREESLVSGLDSDAGTDRKELKRSSRKRDSRQSTPIRATRRSTRSQTSRLDEEVIITQETTTTTTISHENVILNTVHAEPSEISAEPTQETPEIQETQEPTSKGGKRKKKGKKGSKQKANDDVDALDQELTQSDARIADKIQRSQDLIDASEELLHQSESLDERAERVLADSENPFSTGADDDEETFAQREDDEDQTFHSTKQFETADDAEEENGESESPLYPVLDEEVDVKFYPDDEEDDQENADTVKYYASESPAATGPIDVEMDDEAQTSPEEDVQEQEQEQDRAHEKDLQEQAIIALEPPSRNPSPPAATLSSTSPLMDGEEVAFSPMVLSRSPTPTFVPSTPPATERFEDCLPIVTPKAERMKPKSAIEEALPMSNVEFLADFFKEQNGRALTREQANHCQRLIEEAVRRMYTFSGHHVEGFSSSLEALTSVPDYASPITTHAALIPEQNSPLKPTTTPIANPTHRVPKRTAPFEVKRQAISDLYHDGKAETAHRPALPPLDEYLEIKKYEGVDWDDLPNQVKVKRLLEWKGTEAPEVLKKRKIEERRLMKEKNAEVWGRDKKDDVSEQATKGASALKRNATTSGMISDDDEDEESLQRKKPSTSTAATVSASLIAQPALTVPAAAATANAVTKDAKAADAPKVSSIAQKLLDIVGKDSMAEDEDTTKKSVEKTIDNVVKTIAAEKTTPSVTPAVPSPFNFGVPSVAKESISEASKPVTFSFGTPAATGSTPEAVSSGSIFAKPATITPVPASTSTPPQSSAPGFSFSTPASDSKEVPKSPSNFGVSATSPAASSGVLATTSPFALGSGSSKETTTTATTKPAASPFGAAPSFSFGDAKSPSAEIPTTSPFGAAPTSGFSFGAPKSPSAEKTASSPFVVAGSGFSFGVPKLPTAEKSTASPFGASSGISFGASKSPSAEKSTTSPFAVASGSGFSFGVPKSPSASKSTTSPFGAPKSPTAEKPSTFSSSGFSSFSSTTAATKTTAAPTFNFGVTPGFAAAGAFGGAAAAAATSFAPAKFGNSTGFASANPFAAVTSMGLKKKDEEPEVILLSDEEDGEGDGDDDGDNEGQEERYSGDEDQYDDDEGDQHEGTGSYEGEEDDYSQEDSYGGEEDDYGDEDGDEDDQEGEDDEDKAKAVQAASKPGGMFNFAPSGNPFGQAVSSSSTASVFSRSAPKSPEFDFTFGSSSNTTTTAAKFSSGGGFGGFSGFGAGPSTTTPTSKPRSSGSGNISDLEMSPVLTYRAGSVDTDEGEISPLSSPVLGPQH